jgi:hypothetical protein
VLSVLIVLADSLNILSPFPLVTLLKPIFLSDKLTLVLGEFIPLGDNVYLNIFNGVLFTVPLDGVIGF